MLPEGGAKVMMICRDFAGRSRREYRPRVAEAGFTPFNIRYAHSAALRSPSPRNNAVSGVIDRTRPDGFRA